MPGKMADPKVDVWFTDGAGINEGFCAGVCKQGMTIGKAFCG